MSLRPAWATQWDRISKRKSKTKQKTLGLCSKQWFKCYWGSRAPLNILALQKAYPMPSWHSIAFHYLHRTKWSRWGSCCRSGVQLLASLEYTGQNRIVLGHTLSVHTLAKTDEKKNLQMIFMTSAKHAKQKHCEISIAFICSSSKNVTCNYQEGLEFLVTNKWAWISSKMKF